MDFSTVASQLWPCWMLGIFMIYCTWKSQHKDLLRVEVKPLLKFMRILAIIAVCRFFMFKFFLPAASLESAKAMAHMIPLPALLGTFWEDAAHSMPLVIAGLMFGTKKWYGVLSKIALVVVSLSFGSGHIYQGLLPAIAICFYIPVAMKLGKQYGFGTVMISHILYDLSTIISIRMMLG